MSCPYLKEVTMVFCKAYPVKKAVPLDRVTTASRCGGGYEECPLFKEALEHARAAAVDEDDFPSAPATKKGVTP